MKKKLLVGASIAVIGAVIGQLIPLAANAWIKTKVKPVLVREAPNWNPSTLPLAVQKQITYVPVNYTLRHNSGLAADHVTVFVKSDLPISPADVTFTSDSEVHQLTASDPHTLRIDIPEIRPSCLVSCQIIATNTAHLEFAEVGAYADFVDAKDLPNQAKKSATKEILIVSGVAAFWLAGLVFAIYVFVRVGRYWKETDAQAQLYNRRLLIGFIIGLIIYNLVLGSLGPIGMWIPLPRFSIEEVTSAFILFLIVTRYQLVEAWLISHTKKDSAAAPAPAAAAAVPTPSFKPVASVKTNGEKTGHTQTESPVEALVE